MKENRTGDLAELKVQSDLVAQGFNVSVPIHEIEYDLIAEQEGTFYRVQTKTGTRRKNRGSIQCQVVRSSRDYDTSKRKYDKDSFDVLAMWCKPTNDIVYTEWNEPRLKYSVRESADEVPSNAQHMVNVIEDETIDSAIERLK